MKNKRNLNVKSAKNLLEKEVIFFYIPKECMKNNSLLNVKFATSFFQDKIISRGIGIT
jgi:hypothetical protein